MPKNNKYEISSNNKKLQQTQNSLIIDQNGQNEINQIVASSTNSPKNVALTKTTQGLAIALTVALGSGFLIGIPGKL